MKKTVVTEDKLKETPAGGALVGERHGQTIVHKDGTMGGYLVGDLHKDGGIKAINKSTGKYLEMQGAEVVITAPAVADQTKREFEGRLMTNRQILSEINSRGGGVSFADGGEVPSEIYFTGDQYNYGGKLVSDHDIAYRISQCGCQHAAGGKIKRDGNNLDSIDDINDVANDGIVGNDSFESGGEISLSDLKDVTVKPKVDSQLYDTKKGEVVTVTKVAKPSKQSALQSEPYLIDIKYKDGKKAINMAIGDRFKVIDAPQQKELPADGSLNPASYKNPYVLNRAIEKFLNNLGPEETLTVEQINFISLYSGYGGLEKQGSFSQEELKGLLYEYYTPDEIVKKMWALAYQYGFGTIPAPMVKEPSVGTGNFFRYAPENASLYADEINPYSKRICELLYPRALVNLQPFEKNFIQNNRSIRNKIRPLEVFDLVIGNPPYGMATSKYMAMGEGDYTGASSFTEYFITRGLDLLKSGGLLIFVVGAEQYNGGTLFLDGSMTNVKRAIHRKAELLDAYRLPTKIFERTGVASEILVFKKR